MDETGAADLLAKQIASDLEGQIDSQALMPGDKLPSEAELSRQYMANRYVVRRALRLLETRGIVDATQGRGRFVRLPAVQVSVERTGRVPIATTDSYRSETRQINAIKARAYIAEALSLKERSKIISVERMFFADRVPIGIYKQYIRHDRFPGFISEFNKSGGSVSHALAASGVDAFELPYVRLTSRLPSPEECDLMHVPPHAPLMVLRTVSADKQGVIGYSEARLPSDRVEIDLASH